MNENASKQKALLEEETKPSGQFVHSLDVSAEEYVLEGQRTQDVDAAADE
jgi:hypothetical protein